MMSSFCSRFEKPRFVPLIMTIGAVVMMFGLGIWQVQRLAWKEGLIHNIEEAKAKPPIKGLPQTKEEFEKLAFQRVQLEGEYLNDKEFHLAARYNNGVLGYHVLTPFKTTDGRYVLLNRGWVPTDKKDPAKRKEGQIEGNVSVITMVRTDRDRGYFTPKNQIDRNIWFAKDVKEMGEFAHLDLAPYALDVLYEKPPGGFPKPFDGNLKPRNDHFGYAITWFSIGIACLIISLTYHYRRPEASEQN